jgi:hypothetical protein
MCEGKIPKGAKNVVFLLYTGELPTGYNFNFKKVLLKNSRRLSIIY